MNKSDYFIEREKKRMDKVLDDDKTIALKLDKIYKKNFKEIENQIDIFLGRYAFKENISMLEARKLVNNLDLKEYATKAKEYVKNKDLSDKANREMSIYNLKLKVTRLEMLKKNIALELARLGSIEEDELQKHLEDIAQNQVDYNANIFNMSNKTQKDILENSKEIINASYKEATFSDRIWANQRGLKADLDKLIDRTILRGESPQKWAKELKRNLQDVRKNARFNAERLAITESHRVLNDINLMSIKEAGYNCVKIISEPGACHICKPHDGKIVNLDDKRAIAGDKLPTWHPYCRCSFVAYDDNFYDLDIDKGKQNNHIKGTNEFKQRTKKGIPPSYYENTIEEIERIGKTLIGTGILKIDSKNPNLAKEKVIVGDKLIGTVVNNINGKTSKTTRAVIKYNKGKGWHMYPDYPKKGD